MLYAIIPEDPVIPNPNIPPIPPHDPEHPPIEDPDPSQPTPDLPPQSEPEPIDDPPPPNGAGFNGTRF
jgi:hypothetical protein